MMEKLRNLIQNTSKVFAIGVAVAVLFVGLILSSLIVENLDADQIMVVQSPFSGELTWHTDAGIKPQYFGKVTTYPKRSIYRFETSVRFNDGGHGTMFGSVQYEMPLDKKNLTALHVRFGSQEAIQKQLIETITNKAVYMTGPLMSSKESYAEKRNYLIHYVEDQISNGVYKTFQRELKTKDAMTGSDKTVTVVEIAIKNGIPERQEEAVLGSFGIKAFNFAIDKLPYDEAVETQIKQQQQITMDVQTAIADAKKAEQRAITVAKQGEANAAQAKWEQEVVKAKEVTLAQQKLEVAKLEAQAAEQYKKKKVLEGEADGAYKRTVMMADGALTQKLTTYEKVMERFANALGNYQGQWVPSIVMGANGLQGSPAMTLIELLNAKTAKDLSLDLSVPHPKK